MDQELKTYLDQHFHATSQQIQQLREEGSQHIQQLREEGSQQIQQLRGETSQQAQQLREGTTRQIQQLQEGTFQQIQQLREGTTQQIQQLREENGRQFAEMNQRLDRIETDVRGAYVAIEGLHGHVQLVAEGVANVTEQLRRHEEKVSRDLTEIKSFNRLSYKDLDNRVRKLEAAAG